jgi:hypothetical protein
MSEGDAFRGISSQESQDQLIRIETRLRGATIGDAGRRPWRFQNQGSPSDESPDEPSLRNEWPHIHARSLHFCRTGSPRRSPDAAESKVIYVPEVITALEDSR